MKRGRDRAFLSFVALVTLLYWTVLLQWWDRPEPEERFVPAPVQPSDIVAEPALEHNIDDGALRAELEKERAIKLSTDVGARGVETETIGARNTPQIVPFVVSNDDDKSGEVWAGSEVVVHDKQEDLLVEESVLTPIRRFNARRRDNRKFFFYQPSGGFGNQRLILRWAMIVANAMNRTLAVAPLAPHSDIWHGYNQWRKEDLVPAYKVLDARALNEAIDAGVVFLDDTPARIVDRAKNDSSYTVRVHIKGHYVDRTAANKKLLVYRESEITETWRPVTEDIVFWDKMSMWGCCSPEFPPDSVWYGRHIMFNSEFKTLAKQLMSGVGDYNAVHVRRGDMTISRDRRSAEVYYKTHRLDRFDKRSPLYIATNEKDKAWFDAFKEPGRISRLLFWDDLDTVAINSVLAKHPPAMRGDILGFIELLICGNAVMWEGSKKSTFSASISAIRMAPQLRTLVWMFPPKPSVRKASGIAVPEESEELFSQGDD